jgi:Amt family ammonium transporter
VNGILAGLVAITSPCAFVNSTGAVLIGLVAGAIVVGAASLLERLRVDDPVGAVPVHFFNGIWGLLSVGIFADGAANLAGWNGVDGPVTGLLFGGGTQILAQLAEVGPF